MSRKIEYLTQDITAMKYEDVLFKVYFNDERSEIMTMDEIQHKFYNEMTAVTMSVDNVTQKVYIRDN